MTPVVKCVTDTLTAKHVWYLRPVMFSFMLSGIPDTGNKMVCSPDITSPCVDTLLCALSLQGAKYNGSWDGPPFEVNGNATEFSLAIFGEFNILYYPLFVNETYTVDVSEIMSQPFSISFDHVSRTALPVEKRNKTRFA